MREIGFAGPDAPRRAAAEARALSQNGIEAALRLLTGPADDRLGEDERSFVTAYGQLLRRDAFWLEWADSRPLLTSLPREADVVILVARDLADLPGRIATPEPLPLPIDAYGRPLPVHTVKSACRIAILGRAEEQGAVLAALGDAADRLGIAVSPIFFSGDMPEAEGLILPGGADLSPVEDQIAAARVAIAADLPLFGLCLGMQCFATALLRDAWPDATLEEIAGPGPRRSFVRWTGLGDLAQIQLGHRLGDRPFHPAPGSRLAALLPGGATIRMNHRYHLAPNAVFPMNVCLHGSLDGPIDGIELSDRRFCLGLQGHPEFGCDPAMKRLWDNFLRAVLK